ncbi:hypothetical protein FQR65_LT10229 [Abscondita terminalis]|nr:hypothetical protein FQR65_LT10229 [Abscondita terminalis]
MNTIIKRSCSTTFFKNAFTFSNRLLLNATESSVLEPRVASTNDVSEFHISMYPYLVRDGILRLECNELNSVVKRFDDMCYYTGPERELSPSFVLLNFYKTLESPHRLTLENFKLASLLAWSFEMIATGLILEDDIMDNTKLRWKKKSYHELQAIGLSALSDAKKLYMSAFRILRKYFKDNPAYVQLIDLLCKTMCTTSLGQSLDVNTNSEFKRTRNLNMFSYDRCKYIAKYKTGYMLYKGPPLAAMHLAEIHFNEFLEQFMQLCDKFATYRQAQDDVWDVYGDINVVGKLGSDITNGKCTWLIVTAMKYSNKQQLSLLQSHYGKEDVESQTIIKRIYQEIDVLGKFEEYKREFIKEVQCDIPKISLKPLRDLCYEHIKQCVDINEQFVDYHTLIN